MVEESKRLQRARRWEEKALDSAVRAFVRYRRAQEYTRLVENQENLEDQVKEMTEKISQTKEILQILKTNVDDAARRTEDG